MECKRLIGWADCGGCDAALDKDPGTDVCSKLWIAQTSYHHQKHHSQDGRKPSEARARKGRKPML